jgi:multiple sugar transport system ATP-binding protein
MVEATVSRVNGSLFVHFAGKRLEIDAAAVRDCPGLSDYVGRSLILGVRPESIEDASIVPEAPESRRLGAVVDLREALGSDVLVHFAVEAPPVLTEDTKELARDTDSTALEQIADQPRSTFVARLNAASRARERERIELVVDTRALHFFDPTTGEAIDGRAAHE